ncbi:MAG: class I SAM-dependent methyltransferase [Phycisphaeraceae bacterium]|nr:class I SAM-dependent methyltransferase [Phycisphaeraceae bacterium]
MTEPVRLIRFLDAAHGRKPKVLREDFSGSGALARAWAASHRSRGAVAVDIDPGVLVHASSHPRVTPEIADAKRAKSRADIVAATNFPIGYQHTRAALLQYLKNAKQSLKPGGIFVCDLYGGRDAFSPGKIVQMLRAPRIAPWNGELVEYTFEQRAADPISGLVLDALHFRVWKKTNKGKKPDSEIRDAFVYHWRLWSLPELNDALREAGFRAVEVHDRLGDAVDSAGNLYLNPNKKDNPVDENWVVYVVARQ